MLRAPQVGEVYSMTFSHNGQIAIECGDQHASGSQYLAVPFFFFFFSYFSRLFSLALTVQSRNHIHRAGPCDQNHAQPRYDLQIR